MRFEKMEYNLSQRNIGATEKRQKDGPPPPPKCQIDVFPWQVLVWMAPLNHYQANQDT